MLRKLLYLGIFPEQPFELQNKLRVFNSACLLALAISCFYFVYGTISGFYLAEMVSFLFFLLLCASLWLIGQRRYQSAFHLGMIGSFIFVSSFTVLFGNASKSFYYFLFMPVASTILFDGRNTSGRYLLLSIFCLLINVAYSEYAPSYYGNRDIWYFGYPNMVFTLLLIYMGVRVFKLENRQYAMLIEEQKHGLEEKNLALTDSISYARRIQYTLLAQQGLLDRNLPEHFVLFRPKDMVSGDFYWAAEKDGQFYLAVCDSTGHGVPGAFMSLLNVSFLNEAVNEKKLDRPDEILNHVRKRLIDTVSPDGARDGMDAVLLRFNRGQRRLDYAAANNSPLLLRDGGVTVLKKDKMPVGMGERSEPFSLVTIEPKAGDILYLLTDGYADQFGGPAGKKFKLKQLETLLPRIGAESLQRQKELLLEVIQHWQGPLEQVDDMCMVGIRF